MKKVKCHTTAPEAHAKHDVLIKSPLTFQSLQQAAEVAPSSWFIAQQQQSSDCNLQSTVLSHLLPLFLSRHSYWHSRLQ